jgi:hypothetical protein
LHLSLFCHAEIIKLLTIISFIYGGLAEIDSSLMSYITSTFQSKSDMRLAEEEWQKIIQEMSSRFKSAGAIRQTVSQVWNKEGAFMLGNMWEYRDEKAFVACQSLFREAEKKFAKRTSIAAKKLFYYGHIST